MSLVIIRTQQIFVKFVLLSLYGDGNKGEFGRDYFWK